MGLLEPHVRHRRLFRGAVSRNLDDASVAGQRVLLRADLNVPVQDGKVSDTTRLERLAPTMKELSDKGARHHPEPF
jgi:3-phosphoglycerate kinase